MGRSGFACRDSITSKKGQKIRTEISFCSLSFSVFSPPKGRQRRDKTTQHRFGYGSVHLLKEVKDAGELVSRSYRQVESEDAGEERLEAVDVRGAFAQKGNGQIAGGIPSLERRQSGRIVCSRDKEGSIGRRRLSSNSSSNTGRRGGLKSRNEGVGDGQKRCPLSGRQRVNVGCRRQGRCQRRSPLDQGRSRHVDATVRVCYCYFGVLRVSKAKMRNMKQQTLQPRGHRQCL